MVSLSQYLIIVITAFLEEYEIKIYLDIFSFYLVNREVWKLYLLGLNNEEI